MFAAGEPYRLLGLIPARLHLFGVDEPGGVFLFGTDAIGRDVFSRTLYAARVSLLIGLVGVFLTFAIGVTLGGISGYFGGRADMLIQRAIEFLMSIPTIPLWLALSAADAQGLDDTADLLRHRGDSVTRGMGPAGARRARQAAGSCAPSITSWRPAWPA